MRILTKLAQDRRREDYRAPEFTKVPVGVDHASQDRLYDST